MGHNTAEYSKIDCTDNGRHFESCDWCTLSSDFSLLLLKRILNNPFGTNLNQSNIKESTGERGMLRNLERSSLEFSQCCDLFLARHGLRWLTRTCTKCLQVVVGGMHDSCVCVMSVCEIYPRMIIKLTVQAFAILCLFFILFLFSLCVMPLRCLVS